MARTQSRWLWISLLISLAIIAVVLLLTINQDTLYYLQHLDPYFLVIAVAFRILSLAFWGGKIKYLSRGLLYSIGLLRSFEIGTGQPHSGCGHSRSGGRGARADS